MVTKRSSVLKQAPVGRLSAVLVVVVRVVEVVVVVLAVIVALVVVLGSWMDCVPIGAHKTELPSGQDLSIATVNPGLSVDT